MSYQVFARKYRPKTFDDVLGQDHVVRTLKNAIEQKRLAHAYLFVGPRGTGKTSTARIFAKALNGSGGPRIDFDPDEDICVEIAEGRSLDVLEIDGASNNGVDQVRELREIVRYMPAKGQFKIIYIDEVHMLSTAAFNALLKTLEEPPEHVKFIFATTEVNKILPTILSRCQRFDLRPIPAATIAAHLLHIASEENFTLDEAAARAIAKGADGGMRDAQSMLDQLVAFCGTHITEAHVLEVFGFTSQEKVAQLVGSMLDRDTTGALAAIQREAEAGRDLSQLLGDVVGALRALLVSKLDAEQADDSMPAAVWQSMVDRAGKYAADRLLSAIDVFAETESRMKFSNNRRLHFELGTIKAVQTLGEIRLSEVIKLLASGSSFATTAPAPAQTPIAAPVQEEVAPLEPAAEVEPASEEPAPAAPVVPVVPEAAAPVAAPERPATRGSDDISSRFASLIEAAPETSPDPEPPPWSAPAPEVPQEKPEPAKESKVTLADTFYQDPLIQAALEQFEGKLVG